MSAAGLRDLARHEGVVRRYYNDPHNCTYGIGTLVHPGRCSTVELRTPVTDTQIATSLHRKVDEAVRTVRRRVSGQSLTQSQFDALVSLTYNLGAGGASHVLHEVNRGHFARAASLIGRNIHVTVRDEHGNARRDVHGHKITEILPGLITRRRDESAPFLAPEGGSQAGP